MATRWSSSRSARKSAICSATVRLNGVLSVFKTTPTGDVQIGAADDVNMDPRLGVFACIDQLVISSAKTSQTIEHIKNYNTMLSTYWYLPVSSSPQDLVGHMGVTSLTSANVAANKIMVTQVNAFVILCFNHVESVNFPNSTEFATATSLIELLSMFYNVTPPSPDPRRSDEL